MKSRGESAMASLGLCALILVLTVSASLADDVVVVGNLASADVALIDVHDQPGPGVPAPAYWRGKHLWIGAEKAFPEGVAAVTTGTETVGVIAYESGHIAVLDLDQFEVRWMLTMGPNPWDNIPTLDGDSAEPGRVAMTTDGQYALILESGEIGQVSMIDLVSGLLVGSEAMGDELAAVSVSSNDTFAVVGEDVDFPLDPKLYKIDLLTFPSPGSVCEALLPGVAHEMTDVTLLPGDKALILSEGQLILLDDVSSCPTLVVLTMLCSPNLDGSENMCVTADGNYAYVSADSEVRQFAIDHVAFPYSIVEVVPGPFPVQVGLGPAGIALNPAESWVLVANSRSSSLNKIEIATGVSVDIPVCGRSPNQIAVVDLVIPSSVPLPPPTIADLNNDLETDISDVIYLLSYLFSSGPPPPPTSCGRCPTP